MSAAFEIMFEINLALRFATIFGCPDKKPQLREIKSQWNLGKDVIHVLIYCNSV